MINVLLVDDHVLIRDGIRAMLSKSPAIDVVGEAGDGESAVDLAKSLKPDVIMMDLDMPGIGGLEATRKILRVHPKTKIIILSMHHEDPFPSQLLDAGAMGYMTKSCSVDQVVDAINTVYKGSRYLEPNIAQSMANHFLNGGKKTPFDTLSQREMQVMLMITKGCSISDISDQLCLSPKTISTYRYRLYEKIGVTNDVELTRLAIRYALVDTSQRTA